MHRQMDQKLTLSDILNRPVSNVECLCRISYYYYYYYYHHHLSNHLQNFIQHPAVKVNSICAGNYRGSSVGFRRNSSTIDHIFCIRQILEKKWEYSEPVDHFFIDFKKAYDSVRREVLYKILIEFGIPRNL